MTKKVISILILIVASLVMATTVTAGTYGGTKDFDLLFNLYEAPKINVTFKDKDENEEYSETNPLILESDTAECKIIFDSNVNAKAKVTFEVFKLQNSTDTTPPTITYKITLSKTNADNTNTTVDGYNGLSVDSVEAGTSGSYFDIDEGISKYPLTFTDLNSNNAVPGNYVANVTVTTEST